MKRWIGAASVALMAFAAMPAQAADKVVVMLNWYVYGEHAPFYYGKAKGIYAAEGIDLEIQEGRGSAATTQAVAAKTADFGYVDVPTMMRAAIKGAPVVATGVLLQTLTDVRHGLRRQEHQEARGHQGQDGGDHAGGLHDPDLAAVPEEDRPEGERLPDGCGRRPDKAQRSHQRPGRSAARLRHGPSR
ncbi:hypothetical protein BRDID11002_05760 [Bradyrhizobium diazoefficiens]